jgi:general secretion pathway protein E
MSQRMPPPLPPRPGLSSSPGAQPVSRRRPAPFEALLEAVVMDGMLAPARVADLLARKESQLAQITKMRLLEAKMAGSAGATAPVILPVELLLSFGERDPEGRSLNEDRLTELYARLVGIPYVKLDPLKLDPDFCVRHISKPFARKNGFLAIDEQGGAVRVATFNPFDPIAHESVEQATGKRIDLVLASKSDIERLITEFYGFRQSVQRAEQQIAGGIELGNFEQLVRMKSEQEIEGSDEHVVHAVDYMFRYAFGQRASDIHIEPKRDESLVRFRIDGSLHAVSRLPRAVHKAVVNRIKTLSRLDIAEKRRPQDGRVKTEFEGKPVEVRVSTLPVAFGEKLVMRIFDPELVSDDIGTLGFFERDRAVFEELIALPHGVILVTGPTGSGKTTTLYTALRKLATDDVNVTTIEDPIENVFEGLNQTAVQSALGLGFSEVLRTILRQDPDIIMVGEIRDVDTAKHAIQAALTGHLVFSTLHTNDAAGAVTRLLDLGVPRFLLASTVVGVMAQRLVKRICQSCGAERLLKPEEAIALGLDTTAGDILVRYGTGCADCRKTGYRGRTAITELFRVTPSLRKMIHEGADEAAVKEGARRDGMLTLREAAIKKLLAGETTYEQVIEVTTET